MKTCKMIRLVHTHGLELPDLYHETGILRTDLSRIEGVCLFDFDTGHFDLCVAVLDHCEKDPEKFVEKQVVEFSKRGVPIMGFVRRGTKAPESVSSVIHGGRRQNHQTGQDVHVYDTALNIVSIVGRWMEDQKPKDPFQT